MALTVNTNIASLTAQRNLTSSQGDLSTSLQRLSSGLRINSSKDDAAGLAISERFTAQIKGLNQGVRNANDGISLAQTAEGALKEVTSNLQRIRELSVQAANATNSVGDRTALQSEVTQLVAEIQRVAANTKFNGVALLDGTFTNKAFQIGADTTDTVSITSIASAATASLGEFGYGAVTAAGDAAVNGNAFVATSADPDALVLNDTLIGASASGSAADKATAINLLTATHGVTATAGTTEGATGGAAYSATAGQGITLTVNGTAIVLLENSAGGGGADDQATTLVIINNALTAAGSTVVAAADGAGIKLTDTTGANIVTSEGTSVAGGTAADFGLGALGTASAKLSLSSTSRDGIQIGNTVGGGVAGNAASGFTSTTSTAAGAQTTTVGSNTVAAIDIKTASGASNAILAIDGALDTINSTRATLGSYQSRFDSIVASSLTTSENLTASRSRIMDADFAQETAQLTKAQILQQSGIAMLAQANSIPQNVLALLQ